jgi:dTDP-4-dehydrorhamnose reductase
MLRLMGDRDAVEVVDDQEGSPTWAALLARALWRLARRDDLAGLWHWSDDGSCTRHGFAVAIQDEALARGLLEREIEVRPVATVAREDLARRPGYSVLDASATRAALDLAAVPWRAALGRMLDEMRGEDLHG